MSNSDCMFQSLLDTLCPTNLKDHTRVFALFNSLKESASILDQSLFTGLEEEYYCICEQIIVMKLEAMSVRATVQGLKMQKCEDVK